MNILVLGGSGFIGSNLLFKIYQKHNVANYDINCRNSSVGYISGDFKKQDNFNKITEGFDLILHLISTTVPNNLNSEIEIYENILPTIRLLSTLNKSVKKVIFISSGGTVYGIPEKVPIDELHATNPISDYGLQKLVIEKYVNLYSRRQGFRYSILRVSNPYGPGQRAFSSQGVIANFLAKALLGEKIEVWGDGTIIRDFIYIDDLITAIDRVINDELNENEVINIGSGIGTSINGVIQIIRKVLNKDIFVEYKDSRKYDVPSNVLKIEKMRRLYGISPVVDLHEGISVMRNSWDHNGRVFRSDYLRKE
jgi:UDP-glucose 4-epimerase